MTSMNHLFIQDRFRELWKPTRKKKYEVTIRVGNEGEQVHNVLEDTHYVVTPDRPFIVKGTVGEEWVITEKVLRRNYLVSDREVSQLYNSKTPMKVETRASNVKTNYAVRVSARKFPNVPIATSWGDTLLLNRSGITHGKGDFLVCSLTQDGSPNWNDMWVVNGEVFETTYDMRAIRDIVIR